MIDMLVRLLSFIVYGFLLNFFFSSWSSSTKLTGRRLFLIVLLVIVVGITPLLVSQMVTPFINMLVTIFLILIIAGRYQVPQPETIFWIILLLAIDFICESLSLTLFESIMSPTYSSQSFLFVIMTTSMTMVTEILLILGIKFFFLRHRVYYQILTPKIFLALGSVPVVSIVVLLSFLLPKVNVRAQPIFFEILIVFGILYMNICVLYLYNSVADHFRQLNQMKLQKKALESEMKYIKEIKKSQETIRSIRHDLKNQFLVLSGMLERSAVTEAKEYLQTSIEAVQAPQNFYTHDSVLNYLLNEKMELAKKEQVAFKIKVLLSERITIDHDVLAILVGNLIDNALAATCRLDDGVSRQVSLVIKQANSNLLIEISNSYNPTEIKTRKNRRIDGLGIKNVKKIVSKYDGLYKQWSEKSTYFVSIILLNIY